jgi:hypothetical protein
MVDQALAIAYRRHRRVFNYGFDHPARGGAMADTTAEKALPR